MTLDEMEQVAKAAQEWSAPQVRDWYAPSVRVYVDVYDEPMCLIADAVSEVVATHIATFSPDVVIKLLRVAKAAKEWRQFADAYEVRGQDELLAALDALEQP